VTSRVSSNVGPSGVRGLSKMTVTARSPSARTPSMLSSAPGRYSSTRRDVDEAGHAGQADPQQRLDALPEGHLGQAAALASSFETDPDPAVGRADDGHVAAVGGDRRVDLGVQDPPGSLGETLACF